MRLPFGFDTYYKMPPVIICLCLLVISCKKSENRREVPQRFVLRLAVEPDRLNPFTSRSAVTNNLTKYLYLSLADFDPYTLQLEPVLVQNLPEALRIKEGKFEGDYRFDYRIRDDARWSDGTALTAMDYLFTLKAVFHPLVPSGAWKAVLSHIKELQIDADDPKRFSVIVDGDYMLARELSCTFPILPKHVFDPKAVLDSLDLEDIRAMESDALTPELDRFAQHFNSPELNRRQKVSSAAYFLDHWTDKQELVLRRVADWWGDTVHSQSALFDAFPSEIRCVFIPDETVALTALKDGKLDLMYQVNPDVFFEMQQDSGYRSKFNFLTPGVMQYYYISMNMTDSILSDKEVRKALSLCLDVPNMIEELMHGLAVRTVGPYHPSKPYYNHLLEPSVKDIARAKNILRDDGWTDSNQNGILDKTFDGRLMELELDIYVTKKELGRQLALLLQSAARDVGIDIHIIQKDWSLILKDLRQKNYQMVVMAARQHPGLHDPYQTWHSANAARGGSNLTGFGSPESDRIIEQIRKSHSEEERNALYKKLQAIIYEEQPMLFLFAPTERIIVSKRWLARGSDIRPGFFVNTFKPQK